LDPTFDAGPARADLALWLALVEEIASCQRCPLHASREHVVVYRGSSAPRVLFVGEAPGAAEDRTGRPFQGRSGARLDAALLQMGLPSEAWGVLNLIKCRPPRNRFDPAAAGTCRPYLDRQVAWLLPRAFVPLGARALHALDPAAPPVLQVAGRPRDTAVGPMFPMIHPAAALRSRLLAARWEHDVQALGLWLREGPAQPV
jgi:uracil-DNA glycosylase